MASAAAPTPALQTQRNLFASFTRISKGLSLVLALGFVISWFSPAFVSYFALLPGRTIPFAWNLVTCSFIERSIITLLVDVAALLFLGRLLEPVWGTKEFVRFVSVVSTSTACATFLAIYITYFFTLKGRLLYTPISGFHGVVCGMLVALKQTMPEQELPNVPLRVKWVPSLVVLAAAMAGVLLPRAGLYSLFAVFGAYTAWLYLRFFQPRGDGGLKGDPSDEFAFASFFPEPLRPFVSVVATVLGRIFCLRRPAAQQPGADARAAGPPLPGSHPLEASRRRERGARALEERLSKAAEGGPAANGEKPTAKAADAAGEPAGDEKV